MDQDQLAEAEAQQGLVEAPLDQNRAADADAVAAQSPALALNVAGQNAR
jgi:hypothetical protein